MNASTRPETRYRTIKQFNPSSARFRLTTVRSSLLASVVLGTLISLLSAPMQAAEPSLSDGNRPLPDTFVLLLEGQYKPAVNVPDLGLSQVNLNDGSYSTTKIYLSGLPEEDNKDAKGETGRIAIEGETKKAIGNFYVQFSGTLAAYDLPRGALTMVFDNPSDMFTPVPDGHGGFYLTATFHLQILEATGIYSSFKGGENHMVDVLHQLADGSFVEHCYCLISRPHSEG
jgi:hypothetical protein